MIDITVDLISYWKCDESSGNLADAHGSITLTNNGTTPFAASKINNGIDFGLVNATKYFNYTAAQVYTGGAFSFAFWVNIRTAPTVGLTQTMFVAMDATTDNFAFMEYRNSGGTLQVAVGKSRFGVANDEVVTNTTLTPGTWYHICCTYDGTNINSYIDSALQGTTTSSGNGSGAPGNEISIGRWVGASNYTMAYIDEVGFWSSALNRSKVDALYNATSGLAYPFSGVADVNYLLKEDGYYILQEDGYLIILDEAPPSVGVSGSLLLMGVGM